jgi:hypothetical protein
MAVPQLTVFDLLEMLCLRASCDTCHDTPKAGTGIKIERRGAADFKMEWWCHGEPFYSRKGDRTANAAFAKIFEDAFTGVVIHERERIAQKIAYYGKYAMGDLGKIVDLIRAPDRPKGFDPEGVNPLDVDCPYCSAPAGRGCVANGRGDRPVNDWRRARTHAARRAIAKTYALERAMAVEVPPAAPPAAGDPPPPEFNPEDVDG